MIYHYGWSIDALMKYSNRKLVKLTGMSGNIKKYLWNLKAAGAIYIQIGDKCPAWNPKTGCPGHPETIMDSTHEASEDTIAKQCITQETYGGFMITCCLCNLPVKATQYYYPLDLKELGGIKIICNTCHKKLTSFTYAKQVPKEPEASNITNVNFKISGS